MLLNNFEINVDNLRIACYNQEVREEDYRYILMVDLDKEELKSFYPNDKLKKEFEYVLMKVNNEFNWLAPDEDDYYFVILKKKYHLEMVLNKVLMKKKSMLLEIYL